MKYKFINITKHDYKLNYLILFITLSIILLLTFITFRIYNSTLKETKKIHQKQQLELAKSAANGISFYLDHLVKDINYLSTQQINSTTLRNFYKNQVEQEAIKSVFTCNNNGDLTTLIGKKLHNWSPEKIKELINDLELQNDQNYAYSSVVPQDKTEPPDSMFFIILIKNKNSSDSDSQNNSFLGYYIYFNWLMHEFIAPLKLSESDFAWILDSDGRLIYHPHHKDMLLRSIRNNSEDCRNCHYSFEIQERMLIKKSSIDSYIIGNEPEKIMAYYPIELGSRHWILAISTYLPTITSNVKNNFMLFFIFYGVAVLLIISLGSLFFIINIKRVKLIESERFLEKANAFQEKINQASKLASIGELVDSVAHEINTPTSIISNETDVILLRDCNPKNCCEELEMIKAQTKRIGDYTKRLLSYSRRMPFNSQFQDITNLIDECIFLVSPRLRSKNIKVVKEYKIDSLKTVFDWGRMEQVIVNLLNNAIDFTDKEPLITIELDLIQTDNNNEANKKIRIIVKDNGVGIKKENLDSVFEPFFSTKPLSKGTGLGLSISKAIMTRHNGAITLESKENEGTRFILTLPYIQT